LQKTQNSYDEPRLFWNALWDRIEFRSKVPDAGFAGDMRISYAKFLHLLESHRVKRVIVYGDMRTAIVEVPHPWTASLAGDARAYPFFVEGAPPEEGHMKHLGMLVPAPDAPDDPRQACARFCLCVCWGCACCLVFGCCMRKVAVV
jgi:cell division protease FtsH